MSTKSKILLFVLSLLIVSIFIPIIPTFKEVCYNGGVVYNPAGCPSSGYEINFKKLFSI